MYQLDSNGNLVETFGAGVISAGALDLFDGGVVDLDPDDAPPPPSTSTFRAYHEEPYEGLWTTSLRDGVTYTGPNDPRTLSLTKQLDPKGSGATVTIASALNRGKDWNLAVWYRHGPYRTVPVVKSDDATYVYVTVDVPVDWQIPGPATVGDRWVSILAADGRSSVDLYKATATLDSFGQVVRISTTQPPKRSDLTGDGIRSNTTGINTTPSTLNARASRWPFLAGTNRKTDVMRRQFRHRGLITLPDGALKAGYIWPALGQDSNAATAYKGTIPMGSVVSVLPSLDVATVCTSEVGRAFAEFQVKRMGLMVGDRSTTRNLAVERPNPNDADYAAYVAELDLLAADWARLAPHLRVVDGTTPDLLGGPGEQRWDDAPPGTVVAL